MRGREEGGIEPNPSKSGRCPRAAPKPVEEDEPARRMGKHPDWLVSHLLDHFLKKTARLRDRRHVSADSIGFAVARPIKTDDTISRSREKSRRPLMPPDMISETMKEYDETAIIPRRVPPTQVDPARQRG